MSTTHLDAGTLRRWLSSERVEAEEDDLSRTNRVVEPVETTNDGGER